mmetsp:Transcript_20535/g.68814  ORF Transcript_20535/g.68814 Transcript_20535/m.68814 type:complete len:230 (-) Transcript_20535:561-1250(-)
MSPTHRQLDVESCYPPQECATPARASRVTRASVVDMLQSYLGADVQLYASQLHRKVSAGAHGHGGHAVPIHQDGDENVLTLWIALDDVDETNGGLRVLRGGHKYGRLPFQPVKTHAELSDAEYFSRYNVFRADVSKLLPSHAPLVSTRATQRNEGMYCYRLKAGGAAMHHPLLPHCSESNMSMDRDRRVIILRFMSGVIQEKEDVIQHWDGSTTFTRRAFPLTCTSVTT